MWIEFPKWVKSAQINFQDQKSGSRRAFLSTRGFKFRERLETHSFPYLSSRSRGIRRGWNRSRCRTQVRQRGAISRTRSRQTCDGERGKITWPDTLLQGSLLAGRTDELVGIWDAVRVVLPAADPTSGVLERADGALPAERFVLRTTDVLAAEADAALGAELALLPDPIKNNQLWDQNKMKTKFLYIYQMIGITISWITKRSLLVLTVNCYH